MKVMEACTRLATATVAGRRSQAERIGNGTRGIHANPTTSKGPFILSGFSCWSVSAGGVPGTWAVLQGFVVALLWFGFQQLRAVMEKVRFLQELHGFSFVPSLGMSLLLKSPKSDKSLAPHPSHLKWK